MLTHSQQELVEKNINLVNYFLRKNAFHAILDEEDAYSAALEGLVKAALKYDPSKGTAFSTYAWLKIRGELLDEIRRTKIKRRDLKHAQETGQPFYKILSLDTSYRGEDDESSYMDVADPNDYASPEYVAVKNDLLDQVAIQVQKLSLREQMLIKLRYSANHSFSEIANLFGLSESRVCQIHARTLKKLRSSQRLAA